MSKEPNCPSCRQPVSQEQGKRYLMELYHSECLRCEDCGMEIQRPNAAVGHRCAACSSLYHSAQPQIPSDEAQYFSHGSS